MFVFLPAHSNIPRRNLNAISKSNGGRAPLRTTPECDLVRISAAAYALTDIMARQHLGTALHTAPGKLVPELFAFSVLLCEFWAWRLARDSSKATLALATQFASKKTPDASLTQTLAKAIHAAGLVQATKLVQLNQEAANDIRAAAAALALHSPYDCQTRECLGAAFTRFITIPNRLA